MPYDAELNERLGVWAVTQWRTLPEQTKTALLPCLRAADEGFSAVQREWLRFVSSRVPPIRVWEAAALCDMLRYLVRHVTPEMRAELIVEVQEAA